MDEYESYEGILEDDALAPLKRNHACLQCKKRKVKCDATRPTCSPCLRSHAHAVRAAQRNSSSPPTLCCTYAEGDDDESNSPDGHDVSVSRKSSGDNKKTGPKKVGTAKAGILGTANPSKIKEKKLEEERDLLKLRIAELEKKIAIQTPSTTTSSLSADNSFTHQGPSEYRLPGALDGTASNPFASSSSSGQEQFQQFDFSNNNNNNNNDSGNSNVRIEDSFDQAWGNKSGSGFDTGPTFAGSSSNMLGNMDLDWDVAGLFMVPANWPMNLPSPFLLEHLVDTFFNCVPQLPRMIHKGNLLYRIRLPPTNKNFPHAALLHSICAIAANHTAWVNSVPPDLMEETATRAIATGKNMEEIEDFGLAQAFAARRAMDQSATCCAMGSGQLMFELVQSAIILSEVFFLKGMPLQGWLMAGTAPRLIKSLELGNRNHGFKRAKEPMLPPPKTAIEREERIATLWMAHIQDSGFAINSYWAQSMDYRELRCPLPTSTAEFRKKDVEFMMENPQTAHSADVLVDHPVPDTFLLVVKASLLMSRTARWLQDWHQREMTENDELEGLSWPSFIELINDIYAFQRSIPAATRNVFRILHQPASGFDSNLLLVHILPNIALCLVHEPFVDWGHVSGASLQNVQRSYEAVVGMLHLIPSNLDVTLVMTPLLAFSLYTTGRIIANFMQKALDMQSFGLAVRYRADLTAVQSLLGRFGQKHPLGGAMSGYLDSYLRSGNKEQNPCGEMKQLSSNVCLDPSEANSYPVKTKPKVGMGSSSKPSSMFVGDPEPATDGGGVGGMNPIQIGLDSFSTISTDVSGFQSQLDMFQALSNNTGTDGLGGNGGMEEMAHISPQSRSTPTSSTNTHPPRSASASGSGSGSFSYASSKTTPEGYMGEIGSVMGIGIGIGIGQGQGQVQGQGQMSASGSGYLEDFGAGAAFEKNQWTGLGTMPSGFGQ